MLMYNVYQRRWKAIKREEDASPVFRWEKVLNQMGVSEDERYLLVGKFGYREDPTCFELYEVRGEALKFLQKLVVPGNEAPLSPRLSAKLKFSSWYFGENHLIFTNRFKRVETVFYGFRWAVDSQKDCFCVVDYNFRTRELRFIQPDLDRVVNNLGLNNTNVN